MPNICQNTTTIKGPKAKVKELHEKLTHDKVLQHLNPMPEEAEAKWYQWRVENWGTKWDVMDCDITLYESSKETEIELLFATAWSPPIAAYVAYIEKNPDMLITTTYIEEDERVEHEWTSEGY